jgi:large subunit ribosomal protein L29
MNASELRKKPIDELKQELLDLTREQFSLRMQKATGQLNKTHLAKEVRANIARVKTVIKQIEGEK